MSVRLDTVFYTAVSGNGADVLDFHQRRQLIASSLSFSELLAGHRFHSTGDTDHTLPLPAARRLNGTVARGVARTGSQTPPIERKHKFASLGRFFKPWKWKRKKKSDKFAEAQRSLERKISVRAHRDELVQKGILLPETPTAPSATMSDAPDLLKERDHLNGAVSSSPQLPHAPPAAADECPAAGGAVGPPPVRPASLSASMGKSSGGRHARWLLCYPSSGAPTDAHRSPSPPPPPPPVNPHQHHHQQQQPSWQRPYSLPAPPPRTYHEAPSPRTAAPSGAAYDHHRSTTTPFSSNAVSLSALPEPPIALTDIGPIPPPPMFSNGCSSLVAALPLDLSDPSYDQLDEEEVVCGEYDDDDDAYYPMTGGACRPEEVVSAAREPRPDMRPLKSALKKRPGGGDEQTLHQQLQQLQLQGNNSAGGQHSPAVRPLQLRHENAMALRFAGVAAVDKENRASSTSDDGDDSDGPILYRDDGGDTDSDEEVSSGVQTRIGSRVQRTDSLALKLALRPGRQELIDRNIIPQQTNHERSVWLSELSSRLNRRLSLRPTAEELEDRNILKTMSQEDYARDMEHKRFTLLRKLSFRPTVEELKQRKVIHFNDYVEVTEAHDYDRRADKPWTRLTPRDKAMIRKELNDFKSAEMDVHTESRHLTRFHRP